MRVSVLFPSSREKFKNVVLQSHYKENLSMQLLTHLHFRFLVQALGHSSLTNKYNIRQMIGEIPSSEDPRKQDH